MLGPLGVAPIEFFTQFLQYTALSTQEATHVAVMIEVTAIIMVAKVEPFIAETCIMQHSFAYTFRSCASRIFRSFSTIYCSFHSANHTCGSAEGSLQPSLWLAKLSSILQKIAKCSTAFHAPFGVAPIGFFTQFRLAGHSCGSDEGSLQSSLWLPKLSSILQKLAKCSSALYAPLGVAPIEFFTQFLQYTALSTHPATHVAVTREAYSHNYGCQSRAVYCRNLQNAAQLYMHLHK